MNKITKIGLSDLYKLAILITPEQIEKYGIIEGDELDIESQMLIGGKDE